MRALIKLHLDDIYESTVKVDGEEKPLKLHPEQEFEPEFATDFIGIGEFLAAHSIHHTIHLLDEKGDHFILFDSKNHYVSD